MSDTEQAEHVEPATIVHMPASRPPSLFGQHAARAQLDEVKERAMVLAEFVESNNLAVKVGGDRKHVQVEGWQFIGGQMGLVAGTEWTRPVPDGNGDWAPPEVEMVEQVRHSQYCKCGGKGPAKDGCKTYTKTVRNVTAPGKGGWEARAVVRRLDGSTVSAAEMECRWDEPNWADSDSYALRSMAQTRAESKAFRLVVSFVMQMAGYSATPAEELPPGSVAEARQAESQDWRKCPACGSNVWDNVQRRAGGWNGPAYKCRNKACDGTDRDTGEVFTEGSAGEPWCTWHENYYATGQAGLDHFVEAQLALGRTLAAAHTNFVLRTAGGDTDLAASEWKLACVHEGVPEDTPSDQIPEELLGPIAMRAAKAVAQRLADRAEDEAADAFVGYSDYA